MTVLITRWSHGVGTHWLWPHTQVISGWAFRLSSFVPGAAVVCNQSDRCKHTMSYLRFLVGAQLSRRWPCCCVLACGGSECSS